MHLRQLQKFMKASDVRLVYTVWINVNLLYNKTYLGSLGRNLLKIFSKKSESFDGVVLKMYYGSLIPVTTGGFINPFGLVG